MIGKRFFRWFSPPFKPGHKVPEGERIYAVGDVHGRLDLLDQLTDLIAKDNASRMATHSTLILLGDLIDRGPDSRGVIRRVMELPKDDVIVLAGNHEEILFRLWHGEDGLAPMFHRVGGREALISYGVGPDEYDRWDFSEMARQVRLVVPREDIDFIGTFPNCIQKGDYLFTHAGIRPGVPLADQKVEDLRWIREEFTRSSVVHDFMVIHGHSMHPEVQIRANRIGIDTGAYCTGKLTALALESDQRWFLSTD